MSMFEQGQLYNRRNDIHSKFGGQQQGGISTPANRDLIFIFTGDTGKDYGYRDEFRPDGTFWYTGEGQLGDMEMLRGNLAVKDHQKQDRKLLLFEYAKVGHVKFINEMVCLGYHVEQRPDRDDKMRNAFIFHLAPVSSEDPKNYTREPEPKYNTLTKKLKNKSLAELRKIASDKIYRNSQTREIKASVKLRTEAIKAYARKRANGMCEGCGNAAPFNARNGPYLEVHHLKRLADGGPDLPQNVAAICPNCHRRIHFGLDGEEYNHKLQIIINRIEKNLWDEMIEI